MGTTITTRKRVSLCSPTNHMSFASESRPAHTDDFNESTHGNIYYFLFTVEDSVGLAAAATRPGHQRQDTRF